VDAVHSGAGIRGTRGRLGYTRRCRRLTREAGRGLSRSTLGGIGCLLMRLLGLLAIRDPFLLRVL
jgi:hypothetical protein